MTSGTERKQYLLLKPPTLRDQAILLTIAIAEAHGAAWVTPEQVWRSLPHEAIRSSRCLDMDSRNTWSRIARLQKAGYLHREGLRHYRLSDRYRMRFAKYAAKLESL